MPDELLGTGVAFPVHVDGVGGLAMAPTGGDDVEQAIVIILSTAPGERAMRPEFGCGIHSFVFERIDGATTARMERAIRVALDRWEPRIEVESIGFEVEDSALGRLVIDIAYTLRATNSRHNLVYPFYVVPAEGA